MKSAPETLYKDVIGYKSTHNDSDNFHFTPFLLFSLFISLPPKIFYRFFYKSAREFGIITCAFNHVHLGVQTKTRHFVERSKNYAPALGQYVLIYIFSRLVYYIIMCPRLRTLDIYQFFKENRIFYEKSLRKACK